MTIAPKFCRVAKAALAASVGGVIVLGFAGCGRKSGLDPPPIVAAPQQQAPAPPPEVTEPANPPQR